MISVAKKQNNDSQYRSEELFAHHIHRLPDGDRCNQVETATDGRYLPVGKFQASGPDEAAMIAWEIKLTTSQPLYGPTIFPTMAERCSEGPLCAK